MSKKNKKTPGVVIKYTELTLRDVLILAQKGQVGPDTKFECPQCEGKRKVITEQSQRMINLMFEDGHPAAASIKPDYEECVRCEGTGTVDPSSIEFSFD